MKPHTPLPEELATASRRGVIAWFARNPVAANLMMVFIVSAGILSAFSLPTTLVPNFTVYWLQVEVSYPGASPEEVEQSVGFKIEEALREIEGLDKMFVRSYRSRAHVMIKVDPEYDIGVVQADVRSAIDGIASFPEDAVDPVVSRVSPLAHAVQIDLTGDIDPSSLRELTDQIEEELLRLPEISKVERYGSFDYEISVEVQEHLLRKYGLSLEFVAQAIRASALDLPGGVIRTEGGDVLVQVKGRRYTQREFEQLPLLSFADGTHLQLGDVAVVRDGFKEDVVVSRINGRPSIGIAPQAQNNQDIVEVTRAATRYAEAKRKTLPDSVDLVIWADVSTYVYQRLQMMRRNLLLGSLLVFLVLALFMDIKLAFWVMMGVPISFAGAFMLMPTEPFQVTLNLISLFALILVLGIVVDDAIIVGESAYNFAEHHGHSVDSVVAGVQKVVVPAIFGVLTTIVAFMPTVLVTGDFRAFPNEIGYVVVLCLAFSILESKLILPAHLAHTRPSTARWLAPVRRVQGFFNYLLKHYVIDGFYNTWIARCIEHRYLTIAIFSSILILALGLVGGGLIRIVLINVPPGDFVRAELEMVEGTPEQQLVTNMESIESILYEVEKEEQARGGQAFLENVNILVENKKGQIFVELLPKEQRALSSLDVLQLWRRAVGEIPGAKVLAFGDDDGGPDVSRAVALRLVGNDRLKLEQASQLVEQELAGFAGIFDIRSDFSDRNEEIVLRMKPGAETLGLSLAEIGRQVRHAFYGVEAQRIQRGNDEIKVMVRYPRAERRNINTLQNMHIRTRDGAEIPLSLVADVEARPGPVQLVRIDGEIAVSISSDADRAVTIPAEVVGELMRRLKQKLQDEYQVQLRLDEESSEESDMVTFMIVGFILAMMANYCLLAVPLRSYLQPAIVMGAVPFSMIGATIGHVIFGLPLSMLSLFGIIAASGVVINDGLILVDFANRNLAAGKSRSRSVIEAGKYRYRAIMLTSLTTFFGLLPIMLDESAQARFIIPMAISLSFGVLFATIITLFLLPSLYVALDDGPRFWSAVRRLLRGGPGEVSPTPVAAARQGAARI